MYHYYGNIELVSKRNRLSIMANSSILLVCSVTSLYKHKHGHEDLQHVETNFLNHVSLKTHIFNLVLLLEVPAFTACYIYTEEPKQRNGYYV